MSKENYDQVIADFNQAIRLNPNYAEAYYERGTAYMGRDDYASASADINKTLQINPNHSEAQFVHQLLQILGY